MKSKFLLAPFVGIYWLITAVRNYLYDQQILRTVKLAVPVISVGNISAGGTGKTPVVIRLAKLFVEKNFRVAVVTRGYRRKSRGQLIVSSGNGPQVNATMAGDEPFLIARRCPEAVVICDADRVAAGRTATDQFGCNLILADDAFQHRRLARDYNLCLWDGTLQPQTEYILPAGKLRESLRNIRRADAILVTRCKGIDRKILDYPEFQKFSGIVDCAPVEVTELIEPATQKTMPAEKLAGKKIYTFCGLGNSAQFFKTVAALHPQSLHTRSFPDHHRYSRKEFAGIAQSARDVGCDFIITTEKDFINLPRQAASIKNLLLLRVAIPIPLKMQKSILDSLDGT